MLTASFTQPTRARKPLKRRRLNDSAFVHHLPAFTHLPSLPSKPLVCSSCNRTISTKPAYASLCARCSMPTCNICCRMCTAFAPSQPPTPALTYSPTPPATPVPSPPRHALSLHTANTNAGHPQIIPTNKRRKSREEDEESMNYPKSHEHITTPFDRDRDGNIEMSFSMSNGCGRIVCRNCCFENLQSDTTTCYDCYGRTF